MEKKIFVGIVSVCGGLALAFVGFLLIWTRETKVADVRLDAKHSIRIYAHDNFDDYLSVRAVLEENGNEEFSRSLAWQLDGRERIDEKISIAPQGDGRYVLTFSRWPGYQATLVADTNKDVLK